jgi:hypothetical protein
LSGSLGAASRWALVSCALLGVGCGKFQQARECGSFVRTVNTWLTSPATKLALDTNGETDPRRIAEQARQNAQHYEDLAQKLRALRVQSEELAPRVDRYVELARTSARTLRELSVALDRGELESARQKRMDFDSVASGEGPLVTEINAVCR